ncbi:lipoate--protein ligase family protein [Halorubellus sp. JP-L1]|uniref:lipoate--protein ligase family protein n=1 Tax=Halorubellus sp. JP-L1 TaxID=2715753 RepID=UPI001409737B|nr:biotin/lipoate A/B protein ligase family protein [Halorubellus sp. JP-L1]NHN42189.1 lipoate--protein ligase family protein [Halorubellus sp. JP-L1]
MSSLEDGDWRLIREEARDGATNMALDEVAARTAVDDGVRTVRVYRWEPSCLSMGYRQAADSVDWTYCEREGIDVTRRQTGGGGIYHDSYADVSYSIVAPAAELPGDLMDCYELLCEPVLDAIRSVGVDADFADREYESIHEPSCYLRGIHPAHDVLAYESDEEHRSGRKLSGNAQYRQRDAVIQHGSISFDHATEKHLGVFADHDVAPAEFRERVTSVREQAGVDRDAFVTALEDHLADWCDADPGSWRDDELDAAADLAAEKYDADAWLRERDAPNAR